MVDYALYDFDKIYEYEMYLINKKEMPNINDYVNDILFTKLPLYPHHNPLFFLNYSQVLVAKNILTRISTRRRRRFVNFKKVVLLLNKASYSFNKSKKGRLNKLASVESNVPNTVHDLMHFNYLLHTIPKVKK